MFIPCKQSVNIRDKIGWTYCYNIALAAASYIDFEIDYLTKSLTFPIVLIMFYNQNVERTDYLLTVRILSI